jgi:hypothetical protein
VKVPFTDLGDPEVCPACQYLIIKNGRVTDLKLNGLEVEQISISGGSIHQFDAKKNELPLTIPNVYSSESGTFGGDKILLALDSEGTPIRGLVIDGTTLKGMITSDKELPIEPSQIPYIRAVSNFMVAGIPIIQAGEGKVTIEGEGFAESVPGKNTLDILIGDEVVAKDVQVDSDGMFRVELEISKLPGDYKIQVQQTEGLRLSIDQTTIKVVVTDSD